MTLIKCDNMYNDPNPGRVFIFCNHYGQHFLGISWNVNFIHHVFVRMRQIYYPSSRISLNSTTRKEPDYIGPDNSRGKDATLDILPSQKPSVVQIESSLS